MWKKIFYFLMVFVIGGAIMPSSISYAAGPLTLYTPYTGISMTPGKTVSYSVEVMNNSSSIHSTTFDMKGLPKDWGYTITSGGRGIEQLSVKPGESQSISLELEIPLKVEKGEYEFNLVANDTNGQTSSLSFLVNVTEQGTFKTELETEQPNMQGSASSTFSYVVTLNNRTANKQLYSLSSNAPRGWDVQFKADGKNITSASLEANATKDINIEVTPPEKVKAETYTIPIKAATNSTSATVDLEAVITGTYGLQLSTPSGKLSTDITAGNEKTIDLQIKNSGTATLRDIKLEGSLPPNWEITFDENTIQTLEAGKSTKVKATITAGKDAIAGDYVTKLSATAPEASSEATFRISVETSVAWGFVGVLIILAVIGGMYYLFKKYGRR
jgi:uncharacterized membrane protein